MADVLADLEAKLAQLKTEAQPLLQAETAALGQAAAATAARVAHDAQIAATVVAQVAAKGELLGKEAVAKVESGASTAVGWVKTAISHGWTSALTLLGSAAAGHWWLGLF